MNVQPLGFDPLFSIPIVAVIGLPFFLFLIISEYQRRKKFLVARIVAVTIVMISLIGIILQPIYLKKINQESILLLTRGYQKNKADSIVRANPNLQVVRAMDASPYSGSQTLDSWYQLSNKKILYVVGQGIPEHALDLLSKKSFEYIPSPRPTGVTELLIPFHNYPNDRIQISGTFNSHERTKLRILGPDGEVDSADLGKGQTPFSLSFTAKQPGNFIYSLIAEGTSGSKSNDRLPVQVLKERQLRILFIEKFPNAEVRFLKNFLSSRHHLIAVRSQISKANFIKEFHEFPGLKVDKLNKDLLTSFDLLFIDQGSFAELSVNERHVLRRSVNDGIGLVLLLNQPIDKTLSEFLPIKPNSSSSDTVHMRLTLSHVNVFPVLGVEFDEARSIVPVTEKHGRLLSGYMSLGRGKVGFQLIQQIFSVAVAGNIDDYASLWAKLISITARPMESNFTVRLATPFPIYTNQPVDLEVTSTGLHPALYGDSFRIPMIENVIASECWTGRSWAGNNGWHQVAINDDSTRLNYFVSDTSEWRALAIANQIISNKISQNPVNDEPRLDMQQTSVPKLLFYLSFLFASAFLWIAPKI